MFRNLFRTGADRRAEEAKTRRICAEVSQKRRAELDESYANLETTQEIMDRVEVNRVLRNAPPAPAESGQGC